MSLEALRPTDEPRLIDLVSSAGVDVSDWASYKRGKKWEAANPNYCYNWASYQPGKIVVLNLWHANMRVVRGAAAQRGRRVYFTTLADLLHSLEDARARAASAHGSARSSSQA
jgi:hypothetical protein